MKTVDNVKRFIPFSNGTDAMKWIELNCDKCKYYRCHAKTVLELGFVTGDITLNRARWIGLENNSLKSRCEKFTSITNYSKQKQKKFEEQEEDKFIYKMF